MSDLDIGMYSDSPTCTYHITKLKTHKFPSDRFYTDIVHFLNSGHKTNIAIMHWPYPYDPEFGKKLDTLYDKCDKVIIIITELHQASVEFIHKYDREKISYYISGTLNMPPKSAKIDSYYDWFETTRFFYKEYLPEIVHRIEYTKPKPKYFDVLLGRRKLHRDNVYNFIKSIPDKINLFTMRYFNTPNNTKIVDDYEVWISETRGVKIEKPIEWTVDRVSYYGHPMSVSQIIPIEVYNNTAYTVVAETNWANYYQFFTEKTAKPIIGRRLFIMIAGQGYLKALRNLGFKTFDGIIDESYDEDSDDLFRWDAACEQMQNLCYRNQAEILEQIQPIVEHNFKVMMETDWYGNFIRSLESDIDSIVQQA